MVTLDWASVVVSDDRGEIVEYLVRRLGEALAVEFQSSGGLHGYEVSKRSEGCIIAFGGEHQRHTLLLSLTGAGCSVLGWYGVSALVRSLIQRFHVKVKFTRLDLALDVIGEHWRKFNSPSVVYSRILDKRVKTVVIVNDYERQVDDSENMAKDCYKSSCGMAKKLLGSQDYIVTGHTTYIGSRTSERFMRIYKKTKESGEKVTRFEYELKFRYASVVGSMMLAGESIGSAYIFANTSHLDISDIYDLSQVYEEPCHSLPRKKERNTFQWLLMISRALVEFMEANPDMWDVVIADGREKSPVCNTGVQIIIPEWIDDIHNQALNMDTFGLVYHPVLGMNFN